MRKEFFSHTWLLFELGITLVGVIDLILIETDSISYTFDISEIVVFMNVVRLLRILRILKVRSKGRTHDFSVSLGQGVSVKNQLNRFRENVFWTADV